MSLGLLVKTIANKLLFPNYEIVRRTTSHDNGVSDHDEEAHALQKPAADRCFTEVRLNFETGILKIDFRLNWSLIAETVDLSHLSLTIDIYPAHRPEHPNRHFGHWDFELHQTASGEHQISLDTEKKIAVGSANVTELNHWSGQIRESGEYRVNLLLRENGEVFAEGGASIYIGEALDEAEAEALSAGLMSGQERLKSAVWFITWQCNMRCPYCWEVQRIRAGDLKPEPYKAYRDWANAWNRLKPEVLDISGGEPFLQPGFLEMLEALDDSIKIAVTTNLSHDITRFVQRIKPSKIMCMTLSFHPTQKLPLHHFTGRLLLLKNRGFGPLTVNYVTWPEQMYLLPEFKELFESLGVRFHVDPYSATPFDPYEFDREEEAFLKDFVGSDRSHWFGGENDFNVVCSGGVEHLNVGPDGEAYRCIRDRHEKIGPVGNILDKDFSLNRKWTFCPDCRRCPGCDKDKVRTLKLRDKPAHGGSSKWSPSS